MGKGGEGGEGRGKGREGKGEGKEREWKGWEAKGMGEGGRLERSLGQNIHCKTCPPAACFIIRIRGKGGMGEGMINVAENVAFPFL